MLTELDRGGDYIELSLDGRLTWNPLSATWLDSYSLASPVASRWNHLFGKGKEPFGQREVLQRPLIVETHSEMILLRPAHAGSGWRGRDCSTSRPS